MEQKLRSFKRKFNTALEPFKVMMLNKRSALQSIEEWAIAVNRLRESVLHKPEQYLGANLPASSITTELVNLIFDEYLMVAGYHSGEKKIVVHVRP